MYSILIEGRAKKTLKKLPSDIRLKINNSITKLQYNPALSDTKN
jgi:mRNA-degrading endonuclease RelE of RelBE toxin-antitoxin system